MIRNGIGSVAMVVWMYYKTVATFGEEAAFWGGWGFRMADSLWLAWSPGDRSISATPCLGGGPARMAQRARPEAGQGDA